MERRNFARLRARWFVVAAGGLSLLLLALYGKPVQQPPLEAPPEPQASTRSIASSHTSAAPLASLPPRRSPSSQASARTLSFRDIVQQPEDVLRRAAEAEEVAIARCMRERGFEYAELPYVPSEELNVQRPQAGDTEAASKQGYGISAQRGEQEFPEKDPNEEVRAKLPPDQLAAWEQALLGQQPSSELARADENFARVETPDGTVVWDKRSCFARGRQALHGDDEGNYALALRIRELRAQARDEAKRATAYQQPLRAWRACMAQRGHAFESPDAARDAVANDLEAIEDGAAALAREVAVAKDDAECDQRVGLRDALKSATEQSEQDLAAENPETLSAMAEQQQYTLARADELLQGRGEEE